MLQGISWLAYIVIYQLKICVKFIKKILHVVITTMKTSTIRLICNCNFSKTDDLDKKVKKVFKMFSDHYDKKESPISKNSDIECVYSYKNLSEDNIRMFKNLAKNNSTTINLKEVIVDDKKIDSDSEIDSDSDSEINSDSDSEINSDSDSDVDSDLDSDEEKKDSDDEENKEDLESLVKSLKSVMERLDKLVNKDK